MEKTEFLQLNKPTGTDFANDDRFWKDNPDLIDAAIKLLNNLARYTAVGDNALAFLDSIYIKNDANVFGYMSDGTNSNLATMENNNIARLGDEKAVTWLMGKDYVSIRSPKLELVEAWDSSYNGTTTTRTVYHSGNLANHALFTTSGGTQTLTMGSNNKFSILSNVVSQFPPNSATSGTGVYVIPRSGVYTVNYTIRPTAIVNTVSAIRFGFTKNTSGTNTDIDMQDIIASSSYGTGFYGGTFVYQFSKGDIITPWVRPLTENITIQSGTKYNIYYLGDTPTS